MTKISNQSLMMSSLTQLQLVSKYKKIRQFQEILLTMLNQTNQNMAEQTSTTTKRKCSTCHLTSPFMSNSQIGQDPSTETFMVQIDDNSAYCLNCIEEIIREEMNQVRNLEERFIYFKEFQSSFQEREMIRHRMESATNPEKLNQVQIIQELQSEESALSKEINKFKEDSNQLKQKIYALEVEEEKFWEGINKIERRTNKVQEKSLNTKFDKNYQKDLLDDLSKNSIIHIFLDIKVDDNLALIQGMAMGKRGQNIDIAWDEITVGLGHLLITFNLLMLKYSYDCKIIQQIKIRGTQSQIWVKGKKKVFGIAYNKDNQKPFGQLMEILLYQTYYISQHILQTQNIQYSEQFKLPFLINTHDHKIGDIFIDPFRIEQRLRWNNWTKAMRYFLIDFKHVITVYAINDKYL